MRVKLLLWSPEVPVVIDGNNLLHAARAAEALSPLLIGRSMLCDALGRWAEKCNERVCVVFDGPAPNAALARQIGHRAVDVRYSGVGVQADAVVAQIVEADSAARRLVVVSSDRAVIHAAKRRRARPVRSEDFWVKVRADLARPPPRAAEPREKEAGLSPDDAQQWLDEFGL